MYICKLNTSFAQTCKEMKFIPRSGMQRFCRHNVCATVKHPLFLLAKTHTDTLLP